MRRTVAALVVLAVVGNLFRKEGPALQRYLKIRKM
jgi:hypothetical protein